MERTPVISIKRLVRCMLGVSLLVTMALQSVAAQDDSKFTPDTDQVPQRGMWSEAPADRWEEALITGNGTLGAMVFGNPAHEKIVLNHEQLYEPLADEIQAVPKIADSLAEARRLYFNGEYKQGYLHSYNAALEQGFPGLQWTDPYHPACAVEIDQSVSGDVEKYWRSTDFETGVVAANWSCGDDSFVRETFASRADNIIVMRIRSATDALVKASVRLLNQDGRDKAKRSDKFGGGYHDPIIETNGDWLIYRCKYTHTKRGYQIVARVIADQKPALNSTSKPNSISFECKEALVLVTIEPLEDFADSNDRIAAAKQRLSKLDSNYDTLLERHANIHSALMNRVKLNLGKNVQNQQPSAEALIAAQKETIDSELNVALLQKMFEMGRYTLLSSSGELPPNLMGLWNGDWRPKWSGDFTLDANVNLQIASANVGNMPEAIASYDRLIGGLVDDWRINAKNLYGCRGILSGCRTSGRGNLQTHFSEGFPGISWVSGAQWLVLPMYEHWQTTGDRAYLEQNLLPLMKEIALFYEDFLRDTEDADGKMRFAPSYSPENRPTNADHSSVVNATMDVACCKEVLTQLLALGPKYTSDDERSRYQALLEKLPEYMINSDGAIKEWTHPDLDDNYDHRHVSHLYPVWPGHEVNPEDTPELFNAAKVAAVKRGRGNSSAHGLAHMALIGARLKDADLVEGNLRFMLGSGFVLPSLCTFHNVGRIYNMDMLNSLPAVVLESLVYSKPGEIELLPALPSLMPAGQISGVACRNQTVVESMRWNTQEKSLSLTLVSKIDQTISVRVRRGISKVDSAADTTLSVDGRVLRVTLTAGLPVAADLVLTR